MYCINCGEKLVEGAKFCHQCGAKQPVQSISTTRSYPPVQEDQPPQRRPHLDGPKSIEETMHSTHDLVDLIQEVDQKINTDLTRHEASNTEDDPGFIGPREEKKLPKAPYQTQPVPKLDTAEEEAAPKDQTKKWSLPKNLVKKEDKEKAKAVKKEAPKDDLPEKAEKKEKAPSLPWSVRIKNAWSNFINEDDDQYSIFAAMNKKQNDEKKGLPSKEPPKEDSFLEDDSSLMDAFDGNTGEESSLMDAFDEDTGFQSLDYTQESILLDELLQEEEIKWKRQKEQKRQEEKNRQRLKELSEKNFARQGEKEAEEDYLDDLIKEDLAEENQETAEEATQKVEKVEEKPKSAPSPSKKFVFFPSSSKASHAFKQFKESTRTYFGFDQEDEEDSEDKPALNAAEVSDQKKAVPSEEDKKSLKEGGVRKEVPVDIRVLEEKKESKAGGQKENPAQDQKAGDASPAEEKMPTDQEASFEKEKKEGDSSDLSKEETKKFSKFPSKSGPSSKKKLPDLSNLFKKKDQKSSESPAKENISDQKTQSKPSSKQKEAGDDEKTPAKLKLNAFMEETSQSSTKLLEKIDGLGSRAIPVLAAAGLVFCLLPLILVGPSPIGTVVFSLIKLAVTLFIFYTAHRMAYGAIELTIPENVRKISWISNWAICQALLFVLFLFYPRSATLGYNMLGAVTPNLLGTILLYLVSILYASGLFWQSLQDRARIQFIGWYGVTFISLELISKLIWIVLNFLTSLV